MKKQFFPLFALLVIVISFSLAFITNRQSITGPHGGLVKEAEEFNIEIKNYPDNIYTWLLDKKLKPLSNDAVSCEARFYYPDNTATDIKFVQYDNDGFTAPTSPGFYACKITFKVRGKEVSARFENDYIIVRNEKE